jgi:integrase
MIRTNARVPKLGRHASGQAVVRLGGKDHYLGRFGTPTAQAQYDTLIAEWLSRGRTLPPAVDAELSVNELVLAYLRQHVQLHYRKNGRPTSEQHCIKAAVRFLKDAYGLSPVSNFGPMALKVVRQRMIDGKLSRRVINKQIARVKACFKWGTENELVPPSVFHGLQSVAGLKAGRSEARETDPVKPVPDAFVDAVLPFVSAQVRTMIELQRLTGMRPGEVCQLRTCDIDVTGKVWIYRPQAHKTEHHGKAREIYLGPRAQDILRPWLKPDLSAYLFSPAEARAARAAQRRQERKTPLWPSHIRHQQRKRKPTPKRPPKDHYTSTAYNQAIEYGIAKANEKVDDEDQQIPHWHPNQLRHNAATMLRKEHGIELARIVLGHSTAFTTEIYAEADRDQALAVVAKIG